MQKSLSRIPIRKVEELQIITHNSEEINWLGKQVKTLKQLVEIVCQKKIESFNSAP